MDEIITEAPEVVEGKPGIEVKTKEEYEMVPDSDGVLFQSRKGYQTLVRKYFPILGQLHEVQSFRTLKSDILSAGQKIVLKYALDEKKMQKAGFLQLIQGLEILNKIERLENNQSTENIAHKFSRSVPSEIISK